LTLGDLAVFDRGGRPALKLERVDSTLSWWSLLFMEPRFDSVEIEHPDLNVARDKRGVLSVAGIELNAGADSGGLADWLLRQEEIVIRGARITWRDELRGAPALALTEVDFRLSSDGRRHRFGLRAVPPAALATPLNVRGDLYGRSVRTLTQWDGQLFAQLDYTDIAAWRAWFDFPVYFPHGLGAVRVWAGLKRGEPTDVTADVQLSQVNTRLGANLPPLDLDSLKGRVGWKLFEDGFEVSSSRLSVSTQTMTLQPMDFLLRFHHGVDGAAPRGELQAAAIDFEPLAALADHLPLAPDLRKALADYAPRGSVYDVAVKWNGSWPQPKQYSVKARFVNLGLNAVDRLPGFAGVSGSIDGSERGGTLYLNAQNATAELPLVFRDKLAFDVMSAQIGWQRNGAQYEIKLNNLSFTNADLAGSLFGSYQTASEGRGVIDLSGSLSRADAHSVGRYIPLLVGERARAWLDTAFLGGTSQDVKLRIKGNLNEFPFPEGRGGTFEVTARVSGGVLEYASGWPKIENMEGDLTFHGRRMDVVVREASIFGAKLAHVHAEIPDLGIPQRVLTVRGEAEGPTSEFLKFVDESPVLELINHVSENVQTEGGGKLALKLVIPIPNVKDTKVEGSYQFINNLIQGEGEPFAYEQVNGKLEFTEASVRVPGATMTVLGGPAALAGSTQRDGTVRLNMAGRVNFDNFRRTSTAPWVQALRGGADWRAAITLRKRYADFVFDSTLQGVASELPAPLAKSAADSMPFRLERHVIAEQQDALTFSLGTVVAGNLQRRKDSGQVFIDRGVVNLGGAAGEPERRGLWITGGLKQLDLDQWIAILKPSLSDSARSDFAGLDVKFGALDVVGRRFNDLAISGSLQEGTWQLVLVGRELVGEVGWRPQGKGKVIARMKNLVIPAPVPGRTPVKAGKTEPFELPALDIYADNFQVHQASLGKLEVSAVPDGRDWRLERLRITNPDATLNIEGVWQGWLTQPRTMVNIRLQTSNIGKLLVRLGQPEGIKGGSAKLEGPLAWTGDPTELDYATLSGNFVVEANKGQFAKLDPGLGKLLGVVSLQSLPRRLSLDFRDIFSEGLAFDEIVGTVKVDHGVAATENFRIQGPAVRIQMTGEVNLSAETQKLRVKVYPSMSDSVSVAGALIGGPVAGIATFVAQKLLKDPIDEMTAYEYDITGTWADPQVAKVERGKQRSTEKSK